MESCNMYLKMKHLVDELLNTLEKCGDKCSVCDEYITQFHRHLIQKHALSPTTNLVHNNDDHSSSFSPVSSNSGHGGTVNRMQTNDLINNPSDEKQKCPTVIRDDKPPISLTDQSLASPKHVDHFSLMAGNLLQEPDDDDNVCLEDPLLNIEITSNFNSKDDLDFTKNVVSSDKSQIRVTSAEYEHTPTNSQFLLGNTTNRSNTQTQAREILKSFKCSTCGNCFTSRSYLKRHEMSHTGEYRFKCDVCGKGFPYSSDLFIHKRTHTGEKLFKCSTCGKIYTSATALARHEIMHSGKGKLKCDVCGKNFICFSELNRHQRTHTGEKPFKCELCGKCFALSANLVAHKTMHTREKDKPCTSAKLVE